ncbi:MAG: TrmH family RNA methyltransferase [Acidimicrobiia bacterium]|nr:TrmH family RNA methyltransferase [Acidimicrobiia bacterium]
MSATDLKRLHRQWRRSNDQRIGILCDGVQNPYNLGAILRSAAAYRVERIWMAPPLVAPNHPKVAKTALGCERLVDVAEVESGVAGIEQARRSGLTPVALELTADAVPLSHIDLSGDVCIVVGHEERGVHRDVLAVVDHIGFLPQRGKVGSLNVAHSLTAALYEISRQGWDRTTGEPPPG